MNQEQFREALADLLPECRPETAARWEVFAAECVSEGQYVNFREVPEPEAVNRWLETTYAGLFTVYQAYGPETATQVADLSTQGCCLYPWEMHEAAKQLEAGTSIEELTAMMREGELEDLTFPFPKLADFHQQHGYSSKRAENLLDQMEDEQRRTLFGPEEKDLVCNYAYHVEAMSKVEQLAVRLAKERFEIRHGYVNPQVKGPVQAEIDRVDGIWDRQDRTGILEYRPVPFDQFQGGEISHAEYLLETGEKLRSCPGAPGYFVSDSRLADGTAVSPHLYRAVWGADGLPDGFRQEDFAKDRIPVSLESVWKEENYLKSAEMRVEQNYNQIDGIINNEPPRVNQGYTILESVEVGSKEFVLAENLHAPQPFVTWVRNMDNDRERGEENFFWGHYFTEKEAAKKDLASRVGEEREYLAERRPSLLQRQLSELCAAYPESVFVVEDNGHGGLTYELPKKWVKVVPPRILSPAQRKVLERMNQNRQKKIG